MAPVLPQPPSFVAIFCGSPLGGGGGATGAHRRSSISSVSGIERRHGGSVIPTMTRRGWWVVCGAAVLAANATIVEAQSDEARFVSVQLLRSGDRVSLVMEMTAEPQKAILEQLSATLVEVEVGPVIGSTAAERLLPPPGLPIVKDVSVQGARAPMFVSLAAWSTSI